MDIKAITDTREVKIGIRDFKKEQSGAHLNSSVDFMTAWGKKEKKNKTMEKRRLCRGQKEF